MKKLVTAAAILCFMLCISLNVQAATVTELNEKTEIDVIAGRMEVWNQNTYLANGQAGVFTVAVGDLTARIEVKDGSLPEGARLMIIAISQGGEAYDWLNNILKDRGESPLPYDIFFYNDGQRLNFEGTLEISFVLPEGYSYPRIYYVSTLGEPVEKSLESSDNVVHFTADNTGYYTLLRGGADSPDAPDMPQTDDNRHLELWTALSVLAVMSLCALVIRKKRV